MKISQSSPRIRQYLDTGKLTRYASTRTSEGREDQELTDFQRAGDYVLAWSEELDAQAAKLFGGTAATKSTLVKRGPKERGAEGAEEPPTKRVKAEGSISDLDDEIRRNYEKGTIAKVGPSLFQRSPIIRFTNKPQTAYGAHTEGFPRSSWPHSGRKEGRSRGSRGAVL